MSLRLSVLAVVAILVSPVAAQSASAAPAAAAPQAAPAAQPIPRTTFLQNMDSDFGKMDANHDRKLTSQEIAAFQQAQAIQEILARNRAVFGQLDTNRDGQLSAQEFAQFHADPPLPNPAPMLQKFDANHDAAVTQVEFRAGTLANFDRLDADKDGVVTPAEMKAGGIIKQ